MRTIQITLATIATLAACGGAQKSGLNGAKGVPPPPPSLGKGDPGDVKPGKAEPAREISKSARDDYGSAYAFFMQNEKGGWNDGACRSAADKFASVVRAHNDLPEAQFMVGLSYQRCGLSQEAEQAYQQATRMKGDPKKIALSVASLGSLYYRAGKVDGAKQYWDTAIKANGKLVGARIDIAAMELEQMRKIGNPKDKKWKELEADAEFQLSSALGVDTDSVDAYTQYGLVYMEGWQQNKNRLDLAKTLLDEGKKRNEKSAPLQNAYGLLYMHRGALNQALQSFMAAVEIDPRFYEARMNVGILTLGFRKYDTAKEMFSKALELQPKSYDAYVHLGIAQRGLGDMDGAEASYKKAMELDRRKGAAYFNLGVLYKDFRATKQADLNASISMYKQAREFFQQFLDKGGDANEITEAKNNIADCDKVVKQLQQFMANQAAAQKAAPPTPPTPPAGTSPAPAPGGGDAPKKP